MFASKKTLPPPSSQRSKSRQTKKKAQQTKPQRKKTHPNKQAFNCYLSNKRRSQQQKPQINEDAKKKKKKKRARDATKTQETVSSWNPQMRSGGNPNPGHPLLQRSNGIARMGLHA
jgi:hypothetical protein